MLRDVAGRTLWAKSVVERPATRTGNCLFRLCESEGCQWGYRLLQENRNYPLLEILDPKVAGRSFDVVSCFFRKKVFGENVKMKPADM